MAKFNAEDIQTLNRVVCAKHIYGLPLGKNFDVFVYFDWAGVMIVAGSNVFGIGYDIIADISVKTEREITTNYVSNTGGAVAGALMFGTLGAIIGGRPKKVSTSEVTKYLIIVYSNKYVCLELEQRIGYFGKAKTLVADTQKKLQPGEMVVVDLSGEQSSKTLVSKYKPTEYMAARVRRLATEYKGKKRKQLKTYIKITVFLWLLLFVIAIVGCIIVELMGV